MKPIKIWLVAMRLPSILLAISSVMMGNILAFWEGRCNLWISLWAIITASLLQIIANLANDYGDFLRGAGVGCRVEAVCGKDGLSLLELKRLLMWVVLLTVVAGLMLLKVAGLTAASFLAFTLLGIIAVLAAITYTMGPRPYAYMGLGDISVFLFFGLVGVGGTAFLHTQSWNHAYFLPAVSCGCFAVAVLNLNNIRDLMLDAAIGKMTLAVKLGRKLALYYQWTLILSGIIATVIFTLLYDHHLWQWLFIFGIPRLMQNGFMTMRLSPERLDGVLQRLVLAYLCFVLLFGVGMIMSVYY